MSKSSTEEAAKAADQKVETGETVAAKEKEEPKVSLAAIAASRAKARAAEGEAEELAKKLEKAQSQLQDGNKIDPATMSQLVAQMLVETRQQVEKEYEPVRQELAQLGKFRLAAQLNLNEKQVDKVLEIQNKFEGMAADQALVLAKAASPDLFTPQQPAWNRALHGGLPVTGPSPARLESGQRDYTAEMHKAAASKDYGAAQQLAAKAFEQRVASMRQRS